LSGTVRAGANLREPLLERSAILCNPDDQGDEGTARQDELNGQIRSGATDAGDDIGD
jgi:hypothetical protein